MKQKGMLVWDCSVCQSKGIDFIQELQKTMKTVFSSIVIAAEHPGSIPSQISDLSIATPVTVRYGPNAIRDAIVDVIAYINETKARCSVAVITHSFPLWISLFQRMSPKSLVFISNKNPHDCLEFSFLPSGLNISILKWPSLEASGTTATTGDDSISDEEQPPAPVRKSRIRSPIRHVEEVEEVVKEQEVVDDSSSDHNNTGHDDSDVCDLEEDVQEQEEEKNYDDVDDNLLDGSIEEDLLSDHAEEDYAEEEEKSLQSQSSFNTSNNESTDGYRRGRFAGSIQPLNNLDKYQIDLRSPVVSANTSRLSDSGSVDVTPKRPAVTASGRDQVFEFPAKFQVLIEAMKSMNKTMISMSDLEERLKIWSDKLGVPIDNVNAYILKAVDQQIVIYDKSINYVRFRNRAISTGKVQYV